MKQKYKLIKDDKNKQFVIQEYSEVDGEMPILLCEETYKQEDLSTTLQKKTAQLTKVLRTHNIFPPSSHMNHIIGAAVDMLSTNTDQIVEIKIDDKEISLKDSSSDQDKEKNKTDSRKENSLDIDKLLKLDLNKESNQKSEKTTKLSGDATSTDVV